MTEPPIAPPPPPPPPPPPTRSQDAAAAGPKRLPGVEDFPEAGPNALATFQQRGLARVADELVVSVPSTLALLVMRGGEASAADVTTDIPWWLVAVAFALQVLYEVAAVALFGQTVGKWLFGLRVARYTDGGRPQWTQSALRCLVWAVPAAATLGLLRLAPAGAIAVFFSAVSSPLRRGWHDDAGGTVVVRTR